MKYYEINNDDLYNWLDAYLEAKNDKTKAQIQHLIVVAFYPMIRRIAYGLARRSTDPLEDLIQSGYLGLIKAIAGYDGKKGGFITYASAFITGEIRHYLRDKMSMIRAPREIQELAFRINQISDYIYLKKGHVPSDVEIAEYLQTDLSLVHEVYDVERRKRPISLDQINCVADQEYSALSDKIVDTKAQVAIDMYELRNILKPAMESLDEESRKLIELYYLEDICQRFVATESGLSKMQVSRKIKYALRKLFKAIQKTEVL